MRHSPSSTVSTSMATICSTPSAPTCSGAWVATQRRPGRSRRRSPARRTRRSVTSCSAASRRSQSFSERNNDVAEKEPTTEPHQPFSSDGATATPWLEARGRLEKAEVYWLSTVRPDGRPHVTPMVAVWMDGALYFSTGRTERKAHNLAQNSHCIITTGCNALAEGLDLVVEGDAAMVSDKATLQVSPTKVFGYGRANTTARLAGASRAVSSA